MLKNKICIRCGSATFVSDRSLGGRMVCYKCGSANFKNKLNYPLLNKKLIFIFLAVIVLLVILL
tara:strand:+ start:462 stop:653 length:192 start_codon:yes stop_codon:yes gene_type:complete